jgi:hypothetical protein
VISGSVRAFLNASWAASDIHCAWCDRGTWISANPCQFVAAEDQTPSFSESWFDRWQGVKGIVLVAFDDQRRAAAGGGEGAAVPPMTCEALRFLARVDSETDAKPGDLRACV